MLGIAFKTLYFEVISLPLAHGILKDKNGRGV